jgi:hypothetical protein
MKVSFEMHFSDLLFPKLVAYLTMLQFPRVLPKQHYIGYFMCFAILCSLSNSRDFSITKFHSCFPFSHQINSIEPYAQTFFNI